MEYVEGGGLDRALSGTPLDPLAAARLLLPLAEAVDHAHGLSVIHRDLKPANILVSGIKERHDRLLSPTAAPKIADFGLARLTDTGNATMTGQILGTPSYMAPEQTTGEADVGPAADIYSLGAILYECLTGRPPFRAATPLDTLAQVIGRDPVRRGHSNAAVPRDLETICLKCLAKETEKRYSTAGALAADLRRFLEGRPVLARPVGPIGRAKRWMKRRPAVAALTASLAALLVGSLAGLIALWLRADREREVAENNLGEGAGSICAWRSTPSTDTSRA